MYISFSCSWNRLLAKKYSSYSYESRARNFSLAASDKGRFGVLLTFFGPKKQGFDTSQTMDEFSAAWHNLDFWHLKSFKHTKGAVDKSPLEFQFHTKDARASKQDKHVHSVRQEMILSPDILMLLIPFMNLGNLYSSSLYDSSICSEMPTTV